MTDKLKERIDQIEKLMSLYDSSTEAYGDVTYTCLQAATAFWARKKGLRLSPKACEELGKAVLGIAKIFDEAVAEGCKHCEPPARDEEPKVVSPPAKPADQPAVKERRAQKRSPKEKLN